MHIINVYYGLQGPCSVWFRSANLDLLYIVEAVLMLAFIIAVSDCLGPGEEQIRRQGAREQ